MRCKLKDIDNVARVLMDKSVYPYTIEDGPKIFPLWIVLENIKAYVLMPNPDTVAMFLPEQQTIYDFHFSALPGARGDMAIKSAKKAMSYMFKKTGCTILFSIVPVIYKNVVRFYCKAGMEEKGIAKNYFFKNGSNHNQIILSKEI